MNLRDFKVTPLLDTLYLEKISDEVYFSTKYSNYISNSRLTLLNPRQEGTPEKFFAGFQDQGFSQAFELGSAVHELTLQPEYFELAEELGKPTAKLGAVADRLYPIFTSREVTIDDLIAASNKVDYYKEKITNTLFKEVIKQCTPYWENRRNLEFQLERTKELIFLDARSKSVVESCVNSLHSNNKVMDLLHPKGFVEDPISENEKAILLDVKVEGPDGKSTILKLKSKLDNYTIDKESNTIVLNDIKTIGKVVSEIDNNILRFHYNREMGMYMYLLKLVAEKFYGLKDPKYNANYLVVSTIPSYYSKVRPIEYKELIAGFNEFKILLRYVAYLILYKGYNFNGRVGKYQL